MYLVSVFIHLRTSENTSFSLCISLFDAVMNASSSLLLSLPVVLQWPLMRGQQFYSMALFYSTPRLLFYTPYTLLHFVALLLSSYLYINAYSLSCSSNIFRKVIDIRRWRITFTIFPLTWSWAVSSFFLAILCFHLYLASRVIVSSARLRRRKGRISSL